MRAIADTGYTGYVGQEFIPKRRRPEEPRRGRGHLRRVTSDHKDGPMVSVISPAVIFSRPPPQAWPRPVRFVGLGRAGGQSRGHADPAAGQDRREGVRSSASAAGTSARSRTRTRPITHHARGHRRGHDLLRQRLGLPRRRQRGGDGQGPLAATAASATRSSS